jgi:hypothetical protein
MTNKDIAKQLRGAAELAPEHVNGRFTVTIDGLKITCDNSRAHILAAAAKFQRPKKLTFTRPARLNGWLRKESKKVLLKRYKNDPDQKTFEEL